MIDPGLRGHVALGTGGNCGIGAAIARALAAQGAPVAITFLRLDAARHPQDPALPEAYAVERARSGDEIAGAIRTAGGRATALEADLTRADTLPAVFDYAEQTLGPVDILVHNASGWLADTFVPEQEEPSIDVTSGCRQARTIGSSRWMRAWAPA
jgi:3-oxoacyl-[acyl-carrier protein] reductase